MVFRKRNNYLSLDDLGIVLIRVTGNVTMKERFERWQKLILEKPARLNFAVITDLSDWSGVILEDEVYSIIAWNEQVRMEHNLPLENLRQLAWIGRTGGGLNQLTDRVNNIPGDQAYHVASAEEAWQLVMPGIPMPSKAKKFFSRGLLF
jgi:hypothetical protein